MLYHFCRHNSHTKGNSDISNMRCKLCCIFLAAFSCCSSQSAKRWNVVSQSLPTLGTQSCGTDGGGPTLQRKAGDRHFPKLKATPSQHLLEGTGCALGSGWWEHTHLHTQTQLLLMQKLPFSVNTSAVPRSCYQSYISPAKKQILPKAARAFPSPAPHITSKGSKLTRGLLKKYSNSRHKY